MWIVILILASALVGFATGRRFGMGQGFQLGMAYGVLDLRRYSLEQGRCPICSIATEVEEGTLHHTSGNDLGIAPSNCGKIHSTYPNTLGDGQLETNCLQDVTS